MSILIGCSGSSGSSLLRTILNRHVSLFSGEETNLFTKERCFTEWPTAKHRLLAGKDRRLDTDGWWQDPHCYLMHRDYGWNKKDLLELISASENIVAFATEFFQPALDKAKASKWIEKTPSNVYSFRLFLHEFKSGKVIHLCRDPLDTIASLVRRGFSSFHAAGTWVYNNAAALSVCDSPCYLRVYYEDLVRDPELTTASICEFLEIDDDPSIVVPRNGEDRRHRRNPGWNHERTGMISTGSVGRFFQLDEKTQSEIITALSALRITDLHASAKGMRYKDCREICQLLGYEFNPRIVPRAARLVRWRLAKDFLRRAIYADSSRLSMYPMRFSVR